MKLLTSIIAILTLGFSLPSQPSFQNEYKAAAFEVLEQKCNTCHTTDLPRKVFTFENMDSYANKIYKQVFVKKKMPKGELISLTSDELAVLKNWLSDQLQITISEE